MERRFSQNDTGARRKYGKMRRRGKAQFAASFAMFSSIISK
jgi:hypothetical protein